MEFSICPLMHTNATLFVDDNWKDYATDFPYNLIYVIRTQDIF